MSDRMLDPNRVKYWVFDLDNTLYPAEKNLFAQVDRRMGEFIANRFDMPFDEARKLQKEYFQHHGTTMRGLMDNHGILPDDFLDFVHDIDFTVIKEDRPLQSMLGKLPGRKVVYTNASDDYALRVMEQLGIAAHFDGIFDIRAAGYVPKPDGASFQKMLDNFSINPKEAVMVEDMARNLIPAADHGMVTVWLPTGERWSKMGAEHEKIDHEIESLHHWLGTLIQSVDRD